MEMLIPPEVFAKLNPAVLRSVVQDVAAGARHKWIQLASKDKSHLKKAYIDGIQEVKYTQNTAVISLVGEMAHMLEDGAPQVDMRKFLLGPNVPVAPMGERGKHRNAKGGYYRAIPFRHSTPGTGDVVGQAMGSAYAGHDAVRSAGNLGREVYKAALQLKATTSNPYGKTTWGDRLNTENLRTYGTVTGPQQRMVPLLKPHHKTDIYQGMVRQTTVYAKAQQGQYTTFRTISTTGGDPSSWIRKPIEARHYAEQVAAYVQKVAPMALSAFLESEA
jgi:hypothetical protein